jgi:hypothetical protein
MLIGLIAGVLAGYFAQDTPLVDPLLTGQHSMPEVILFMTLIAIAFIGLVGVVFGGLGGTLMRARKISPNQGIRLSFFNALLTGPLMGLLFFLIAGLLGAIVGGKHVAITYGLYGLLVGVLAGLWYGGVFLIQHLTLRLVLWAKGYTPQLSKLVDFLDYASRHILLQKVGGGYIYIHRYLQDHFAELELDG